MALALSFWFQSLLACGLISASVFADGNASDQSIIIEEHPSPILIPVNETAVFSCEASCPSRRCTSSWVINENTYYLSTPDQGIVHVYNQRDAMNNASTYWYISLLYIDTSVAAVPNGSNISCVYDLMGNCNNDCLNRSSSVKLLLVLDPPISPNPRIDVVNETHLNITWSPPFLWPGHRIQSYTVSLGSALHDGAENTISDSVNSTYTSETVSLVIEIQQHQINILCSNYTLTISPTVTGTPMQPLTDFNDTFGPENLTSHDQCNHGQSTFTSPSTDVSVSKGEDGGVLLYKVSMFVSLSFAAIFFGILVLIISCACLSHRKKQKEEKARDAKKNIYNTMIPNPIYDGSGMDFKPVPVYECIKPPQPAFYSRPGPDYRHAPMTLATVTAMNDIVQSHSEQQGATSVKSTSTGCHADVPATVTSAPKKSAKERNKLHLTLSLPGTNSVNPLMSRSHGSDVTESTYPCSLTRGNNQAVKSLDQHGKIIYGNSEHYDV